MTQDEKNKIIASYLETKQGKESVAYMFIECWNNVRYNEFTHKSYVPECIMPWVTDEAIKISNGEREYPYDSIK